jgi:hypothetical protein
MAYLRVLPLEGSCVEKWRGQGIRKRSVSWNLPKMSYGVTLRIVCTYPPCHKIYHSSDKESWRQSLLSTMGCFNLCGRNWIRGLTSAASPGVDIWSTCKVGHTLGEFLYLLIYSFLLCLSWLLYCRVRKSRRDL